MNEPTATNPPATPPATPPAELSTQEMLQSIREQMGGTPSGREGAPQIDEVQKGIIDKQFEQDSRFQLEDMVREAKQTLPDATETQAFNIGIAMMKGDMTEAINAMRTAIKQEAEMDGKSETQKNLHVEGGASGKQSEGKIQGLAGAFDNINRSHTTA